VLKDLDRFHLAGGVTDRIPQLGSTMAYTKRAIRDKLIEHSPRSARPSSAAA